MARSTDYLSRLHFPTQLAKFVVLEEIVASLQVHLTHHIVDFTLMCVQGDQSVVVLLTPLAIQMERH